MAVTQKRAYKCDRCGHSWTPRKFVKKYPDMCPSCKNIHWNEKGIKEE